MNFARHAQSRFGIWGSVGVPFTAIAASLKLSEGKNIKRKKKVLRVVSFTYFIPSARFVTVTEISNIFGRCLNASSDFITGTLSILQRSFQ